MQWEDLLERLAACGDEHESLAVGAAFLSRWSVVIKDHLPLDPFAYVAGIDASGVVGHAASVEQVIAAATDEAAAASLVALVHGLDRTLPIGGVRQPGGQPMVQWGPYPGFAGVCTELRLLAHEGPRPPVDRQDLQALALARHRLLLDGPGGLSWDVGHLAEDQVGATRRLIAARLRKAEIVLGAWPGTVEATVSVDGARCAAVGPTDAAAAGLLVEDCIDAVGWARKHDVDVLVLPELYLPCDHLHQLQAALREGATGLPTVTVVGLSHQATETGRWVNEAVLLDARGRELDRYAKVNGVVTGGSDPIRECLDHGSRIVLRSTPFGWLSMSICMDLFAPMTSQALLTAAPAVMVVPSLSPSTTAHRVAAEAAAARGVATVVSNRPLHVGLADAPSFHCRSAGQVDLADAPRTWRWLPAQ